MAKDARRAAAQAGCHVAQFNPPHWYSLEEVNYRTHRKILVVDGEIGFTGGVGVADHWLGNAQDKEHWRDTQVRDARADRAAARGGVLRELRRDRRRGRAGARRPPPDAATPKERRIVVRSSPTGGSNDLKRLYLLAHRRGAPHVDITHAVLRHRRIERLGAGGRREARREDPHPGRRRHHRRDAGEVRVAPRLRATCSQLGIEIYEYQPTMMHTKTLVVDGVWSMFGSANFDNRSLELNDELNVAVSSRDLARDCPRTSSRTSASSARLELSWRRRPLLEKTREQFWRTSGRSSETRRQSGFRDRRRVRRWTTTISWSEAVAPSLRSRSSVRLPALMRIDRRARRTIVAMVRVRFAPSPTGYLHVGGARTALFNWLYARRHGGTFVLRIEDTDTERSSWDMVAGIVDGLRWLGLDWDEGPDVGGPHAPYFQSQRLERYRAMARAAGRRGARLLLLLLARELQQKRQAAEAAGGGWMYDRTCCALTPTRSPRAKRPACRARSGSRCRPAGRPSTISCTGRSRFDNANIEDFVDAALGPPADLSPVGRRRRHRHGASRTSIRGDDHISNTPKQVLLYRRSAVAMPAFAHVPLILGPDKKRLSKRHGATSVMEYPRLGYLPEAMVNFLALLGWSPGDDRELFTRDELIAAFALEGISGGNAVFNPEKLDWFNQQHIMRLPAGRARRRGSSRCCAPRGCGATTRARRAGLVAAASSSSSKPRAEAAGPVRRG